MWSLANEFWYYLVFPLAASLALVLYRLPTRILAAMLLLAISLALPWWLLKPGVIWVAGAAAAWVGDQPRIAAVLRLTSLRLLSSALVAIALILTKTSIGIGDLGFGIIVALWLPVIAMVPSCGGFYRRSARGAAEISYTLYLTHFPLLSLIVLTGFAPHRFLPGLTGAAIYIGLFALAVGWAIGFWWCFERHTDRVFHWLNARLPPAWIADEPLVI
jgi:peptidoglycan/LPS O-acetylase OafA/YrhL